MEWQFMTGHTTENNKTNAYLFLPQDLNLETIAQLE